MNTSRTGLHVSDPAYDPVLDGVGRGLADLFPPIHDRPGEENTVEDDASPSDTGGEYDAP